MAALIILPPLLLQKPARISKNKDHIRCIERRFPLWRNRQIDELLAEGRTLQKSKLSTNRNYIYVTEDPDARLFANKMFQGKVKQALNLLTTNTPLHLEDKVTGQGGEQSVRDILREKHPPVHQDSLSPPYIHPVVLDSIDKTLSNL